jgi:hypothetical protein
MTTYIDIRSLIEDRVLAYLTDQISDFPIVKGQVADDRPLPVGIVYAEGSNSPAAFQGKNQGNYEVKLTTFVYSSGYDSTLEEHRERVQALVSKLRNESALQAFWGDPADYGILYYIAFENNEEARSLNRLGNAISWHIVACLPTG